MGKASAPTCIITTELVSVGKNGEINAAWQNVPGEQNEKCLYSSNYGTAPTGRHAVAEFHLEGRQGKCTIFLPLCSCLYISIWGMERCRLRKLLLFQWPSSWDNQRSQCSVSIPLPPEWIHHNSVSNQQLPTCRPVQACFWVGGAQIPKDSPSTCCVT